jgi:hypothetical protein
LTKLLTKASGLSAGLGLFFRPGHAMVAVLKNDQEREALESGAPTPALREFVLANGGEWGHLLK